METAAATAAITRPNQRLRMLFSFPAEAGHEVPHDFLKHGGIEPIPDELPFPLSGDEVRRLEHAEVVRHRCERDRELLGDFPGRPILLGQQLEDLAPRRVSEGSEQRVVHGPRHSYNYLNMSSTLTKSAPITSLHTMSPADKALDRSRAVRRVLAGLLVANVAVLVTKATIGTLTGSLAVLGDALHSSVDAVYNVLGLVVVRVASREPDEEHPYGHGKFETLGALAIVVSLSITCFELVRSAIGRLVSGGHVVQMTDLGLVLLLATLATNVFVAWYENRRGRELSSELLIADAAATRTDIFITIGVLIGVFFARRGYLWVDPVVAIVVAILMVRVGYQLLARTVPVLVDERAIPAPTILQTAQGVEGVKSAYGIRSRGGHAGGRYAEVTIAVAPAASVADAHAIADAVEARLKKDLELKEVTVHVEPC